MPACDVAPQPGPQEQASASDADILFYGGSAGGGKSWLSVFEAARWVHLPKYNAIVFRRLSTEIQGGGGVWDEAAELYPPLGGRSRESPALEWRFPSGARVAFSHLQHEKDVKSHQSKQYAVIIFEEATHFTESQFWYMLSRNRSVCGVRPYFRGTCNPDPDSFVRRLIDWWIGPDGFPIAERCGVLRYFVRLPDDTLDWADTAEELIARHPDKEPKSLTFIAARLEDNKALTSKDPGYASMLDALPRVERERLKGGNWNIKPAAGLYFQRSYFQIVDAAPAEVLTRVRAWDRAATEPGPTNTDPDWTSGVRVSKTRDGVFYIEHVERFRLSPLGNEQRIKNTASGDGKRTVIAQWEDPGGAGKSDAAHYTRLLAGFMVTTIKASENKLAYAGPVSSQAEAGNVRLVKGAWNEPFLAVLEAFPEGGHDDDVDALSLAFIIANDSSYERLLNMTKL
jgi:predicted phage terminase large subunit-like protein